MDEQLPTVISGNTNAGIEIFGGNGNTVVNCNIGADIGGKIAVANQAFGVLIDGEASNNTIGGSNSDATLNVISGNGKTKTANQDDGVAIVQGSTSNNIWGNYIGVGADGATALGNGNEGVFIAINCNGNSIGGQGPLVAFGNVICANGTEVRVNASNRP